MVVLLMGVGHYNAIRARVYDYLFKYVPKLPVETIKKKMTTLYRREVNNCVLNNEKLIREISTAICHKFLLEWYEKGNCDVSEYQAYIWRLYKHNKVTIRRKWGKVGESYSSVCPGTCGYLKKGLRPRCTAGFHVRTRKNDVTDTVCHEGNCPCDFWEDDV